MLYITIIFNIAIYFNKNFVSNKGKKKASKMLASHTNKLQVS